MRKISFICLMTLFLLFNLTGCNFKEDVLYKIPTDQDIKSAITEVIESENNE